MFLVLMHFANIISFNLYHDYVKCPCSHEETNSVVPSVIAGSSAWFQQLASRLRATLALSECEERGEKAKNCCHGPRLKSLCAWYPEGLTLGRKHFLAILGGNVNHTFVLLPTISEHPLYIITFAIHAHRANNTSNGSTWPGIHILSYIHLSLISLQYNETIQTILWDFIWKEWFPEQ